MHFIHHPQLGIGALTPRLIQAHGPQFAEHVDNVTGRQAHIAGRV